MTKTGRFSMSKPPLQNIPKPRPYWIEPYYWCKACESEAIFMPHEGLCKVGLLPGVV